MSDIVTPSSETLTGVVSLKDFVISVSREVQGHLTRDEINARLDGLEETYRTRDFAKRASYFAEELVFEDPIGMPRAHTRAELETFFRETVASGMSLDLPFDERVIVHDQALLRSNFKLSAPGAEPAEFRLYLLLKFNSDGLIGELVTYFDEGSFDPQN